MAPRAASNKAKDKDTGAAPKPARKRNAPAKPDPESDDEEPQPSSASESGPASDPASESASDAEPAPKRTRRAGQGKPAAASAGRPAGGSSRKGATAAGNMAPAAAAAAAAAPAAVEGLERDPPGKRYFLMKSEPEEFSLDDLAAKKDSTSHWEGVRNAQARNIMRSMKVGDEAFFYHSSCKVPAVVGLVRVVREAYPDHFAFDKSSKYHDPRSTPEAPKWWMVDVQLVRRTARPVTLAELRAEGAKGEPIQSMVLINKSRLSVQPVTPEQWERILQMEAAGGGEQEREEEQEEEQEEEEEKPKPKGRGKAKK